MRTPRLFLSLALVLGLTSLATGCVGTTHSVTVEPVKIATPVSASGLVLDGTGAVRGPDQYQVIKHIEKTETLSAPICGTRVTPLVLDPLLAPAIQETGADAVANLKVYARSYDAGNTVLVGVFENVAIMSGFVAGISFLSMAAFGDDQGTFTGMGIGFGSVALTAAVVDIILAFTSDSTWEMGVEADAVKFK